MDLKLCPRRPGACHNSALSKIIDCRIPVNRGVCLHRSLTTTDPSATPGPTSAPAPGRVGNGGPLVTAASSASYAVCLISVALLIAQAYVHRLMLVPLLL